MRQKTGVSDSKSTTGATNSSASRAGNEGGLAVGTKKKGAKLAAMDATAGASGHERGGKALLDIPSQAAVHLELLSARGRSGKTR